MSNQTWAQISNALVYSTIIVLAVALVAFAADLAFGVGRRRALAAQPRRTSLARQVAGSGTSTVSLPAGALVKACAKLKIASLLP